MRLVLAVLVGRLLVAVVRLATPRERTDERYCATVSQHLAELNSPNIADAGRHRRDGRAVPLDHQVAPLAVEQEWDVLTIASRLRRRSFPAIRRRCRQAADTIRASQKSASAITEYTQRLCNAQIGPAIVPTTLLSGTTTDPSATSA